MGAKIDVAAWVGDGNVSGDALNQLFLAADAVSACRIRNTWIFRAGNPDQARIENFMRVEHWIFDSPDQAGAAFREFVIWFYQENRLVGGNSRSRGTRWTCARSSFRS